MLEGRPPVPPWPIPVRRSEPSDRPERQGQSMSPLRLLCNLECPPLFSVTT